MPSPVSCSCSWLLCPSHWCFLSGSVVMVTAHCPSSGSWFSTPGCCGWDPGSCFLVSPAYTAMFLVMRCSSLLLVIHRVFMWSALLGHKCSNVIVFHFHSLCWWILHGPSSFLFPALPHPVLLSGQGSNLWGQWQLSHLTF